MHSFSVKSVAVKAVKNAESRNMKDFQQRWMKHTEQPLNFTLFIF